MMENKNMRIDPNTGQVIYDMPMTELYGNTTFKDINKYIDTMNKPIAGAPLANAAQSVVPTTKGLGAYLGVDGAKNMFGSFNTLTGSNTAQKDYAAQASTIDSEYTNNPEIQSALIQGYNSLAAPESSFLGMSGSTIKNVGGLADIAGGLYGMYNQYQQNKRADDMMDMYKRDRDIAQKKERDFSGAVSKSGLGTYVTGQ